ncbi:uncharacterized protein LOC112905577 [Agrilus planipennis]|uniref:Uncharacterized protein LOC112905577 n=1 Tax=Agrilus planipennis TaxID=224129 RepID=A0A7F5RDI0_AGRPL|nr:uncharacterized protein LOC112905577 [Agrilus planipennis]
MSLFIMEYILVDFWNPLENYLITTTPRVGESFYDFLQRSGIGCKIIFCDIADFLRCDVAAIMSSYTMSLFFLTCVLHATRVVDFRLLSSGCKIFGKDIVIRLRKFRFKIQQYFTGTKKRIKFKSPLEEEYPCPENVCHLDEHHKATCPSFSEEFLPNRKPKDFPKSSKKRKNHHGGRENTPHCNRFNPLRNNSDSDIEYSDTDTEFPDYLNDSHTCNRHMGRLC